MITIEVYNNDWFIGRIKERRPEDYMEYEFLDLYVNSHTYLRAIHIPCGSRVDMLPNSFISRGSRCPKCARVSATQQQMKTQEQFESELPDDIIALEDYQGAFKKIKIQCMLCGSTYKTTPRDLAKAGMCTRCSSRYRRSIEDVKSEIDTESRGEYRVCSTTYKNSHTPIVVKHLECGTEYPVTRANFVLRGRRCPKCSASIGEKLVQDVLVDLDISFCVQQKFDDLVYKRPLSYDFYLPDRNILIEYQGEQHYAPVEHFGGEETFRHQQVLDEIKRDYAQTNGIRLLEIPFTMRTYDSVKDTLLEMI